jgi:DnaJ domain
MSTTEVLVIVGGLVFGYWVVSLFTGKKLPPVMPPPAAAHPDAGLEPDAPLTQTLWHQVLQVSPAAGHDEIRTAYRDLISQYHPDKVASLGPELRALASRKSKEINAAYDEAQRARGM